MSHLRFSAPARHLGLAVAVAAFAALAGCAGMQPQTPEQAVQARAEGRWKALLARDFDKAWTYLDQATRERVPQDSYKNHFGSAGSWQEASVLKADCQPERCLVRIRLTTLNMVPNFAQAVPTITSGFDEEWLREGGKWQYKGVHTMSVGQIEIVGGETDAAAPAAKAPADPASAAPAAP